MASERTRPLIFVTNGDEAFLHVMRDLLSDEGYDVATMKLMDDPFDEIVRTQPDLLVVDFPYQTEFAWQLLERLNAHDNSRHIPMLATSTDEGNLGRVPDRAGLRRSHGIIIKPLDIDDLLQLINRLIPNRVEQTG